MRGVATGTVLVLGAGGRVGRMLARHWREEAGGRLRPTFQSRAKLPDANAVLWHPGDDCGPLGAPETLVCLWGVTPAAAAGRTFDENVALALEALDLAVRLGARRLLVASSSAVYVGAGTGPFDERTPLAPPPGSYGRAKLEMERRVLDEARRAGLGACCMRMANVAGADSLFRAIDSPGPVVLDRFAGGGGPWRSYLGAADLARAIEVLARLDPSVMPPIVNLAGPRALSMEEIARACGAGIAWRPAPPGAIERVELDTRLYESLAPPLVESADARRLVRSWIRLREDP